MQRASSMRHLVIACVTLALSACAHEQTRAPVTTTSAAGSLPPAAAKADATVGLTSETIATAAADGRITDAIYAGLLNDDKLRPLAQEVDVRTAQGRVTLDGRVASPAERARIEIKARSTPGVASVRDRITVAR